MNNKRKIFIGSRKSNLAKEQTNLVIKRFKKLGLESFFVKYITSRGDRINYKDFKLEGGKGLFTKEIDSLLINKQIDLAIHSAKDIPAKIDENITIGAFLKREDVRDVLVTKNFDVKSIKQLKCNFKFGSSSPRRISYVKTLNPDIKIHSLSGNVESRVKKVIDGKLDGIILAYAGLKRLKLKYNNINFVKIQKILYYQLLVKVL